MHLASDPMPLPSGHLHPMQVGLVRRNEFGEQQAVVVGAPIDRRPRALHLGDAPLAAGHGGVGDVDVHVAAVAGVARVGEELAVVRPERRDVAVGAVGEAPGLAGAAVEQEELKVLGAPLVERIDDLIGIARTVGGLGDRIAVERELRASAHRHGDLVELRALRETRADQQPALLGMPVGENRGADVLVREEILDAARGDRRHALRRDALRHRQVASGAGAAGAAGHAAEARRSAAAR